MTVRFGIQPDVVAHMPLDQVEAFAEAMTQKTITFADEQSLARYLQNRV